MRNFLKNAKAKIIGAVTFAKTSVCNFIARVRDGFRMRTAQTRVMLAANRAENFVDSGIKILIAVVIGALLLAGLYALFGETIMPTVTQKVKDMFDFNG